MTKTYLDFAPNASNAAPNAALDAIATDAALDAIATAWNARIWANSNERYLFLIDLLNYADLDAGLWRRLERRLAERA